MTDPFDLRAALDERRDQHRYRSRLTQSAHCGREALIDGVRYRLGCAAYIEDVINSSRNNINKDKPHHATEIFLANEKECLAVFYLSDELREQAAESIKALKSLGKKVWLVSGDNEAAVFKALGYRKAHVVKVRNKVPVGKVAAIALSATFDHVTCQRALGKSVVVVHGPIKFV